MDPSTIVKCNRCKIQIPAGEFGVIGKGAKARYRKSCPSCTTYYHEHQARTASTLPNASLKAPSVTINRRKRGRGPTVIAPPEFRPITPPLRVDQVPPPATPYRDRSARNTMNAEDDIRCWKANLQSFVHAVEKLELEHCHVCDEAWFDMNVSTNNEGVQACKRCIAEQKRYHGSEAEFTPKFSRLNDLNPGPVPFQLPTLSHVEQMAIALAHPVVSIYKVTGGQWKGGSTHCISFFQNPRELFTKIPLLPAEISTIIVKRKHINLPSHSNFRLDVNRLIPWIEYLKAHNKWYRDVTVDPEVFTVYQELGDNLQTQLTIDDDVDAVSAPDQRPDQGPGISDEDADDMIDASEFIHTGVVRSRANVDETATISALLNARPIATHHSALSRRLTPPRPPAAGAVHNANSIAVEYPQLRDGPINEFSTPGFIVMAFPTLFPEGVCDLRDESRRRSSVSAIEYFQHLLRYKDGRFGRDPRFTQFMLNCRARWQLLDCSKLFYQKADMENVTIGDIREQLTDARAIDFLGQKVSRYAQHVQGLTPFWKKEKRNLVSICKRYCPTAFVTFSAADTHWERLHYIIERQRAIATGGAFVDLNALNLSDRKRRKAKNLADNPHLASAFLSRRFELFLENILKRDNRLALSKYWFRYEWQFRGSGHIHGFLWLENAPDVSRLDLDDNDGQVAMEMFFDTTVIRAHLEGQLTLAEQEVDPLALSQPALYTTEGLEKDLAMVANRVQRHTCGSYCQRKDACRFEYPKPVAECHAIVTHPQRKHELQLQRGPLDIRLNPFNPHYLQAWRANTDFSPIISLRSVLMYVAKYAAKAEGASKSMTEVLQTFRSEEANESSARSLLSRFLLTYPLERDFSCQEACHIIQGLPLVRTSFKVEPVNLTGLSRVTMNILGVANAEDEVDGPDERAGTTQSLMQRYIDRDSSLDGWSLWQVVEKCTWRDNKWVPLVRSSAKTRIIVTYPDPPVDPKNPIFARNIVILHQPFTEKPADDTDWCAALGELLESADSCIPGWRRLQILAFTSNDMIDRSIGGNVPVDDDSDNEGPGLHSQALQGDADGRRLQEEDWQRLARNDGYGDCEEMLHGLGLRDLDVDYDWDVDLHQYGGKEHLTTLGGVEWIKQQRSEVRNNDQDLEIPNIEPNQLNNDQRRVFDVILQHHESQDTQPLRLIISGTAGSGKSYMLNAIRYALSQEQSVSKYCPVAAYTGVAAYNVGGVTLHSLFRFGIGGQDQDMQPAAVQAFRDRLRGLRYLFIDEKSMVGAATLSRIHRRLAIAFPEYAEVPFGGRSVILIGDYAQLPPVSDVPMYAGPSSTKSEHALQGLQLYQQFKQFIRLRQNMRQGDRDQELFRDILTNARAGEWSIAHWEQLFGQQTLHNLPIVTRTAFQHATRLFPYNADVQQFNRDNLELYNQPVVKLDAQNSGHPSPSSLRAVPADEACGLLQVLYLSIGARVMLRKNLWTDQGLVNGSLGYLRGIVWTNRDRLPDVLIIDFDGYNGPPFLPRYPSYIPISTYTGGFVFDGHTCQRIQFPIVLAWAITIHKCQGMTLPKVVVDIGKKEQSAGSTFVAISRVKRIQDLAFSATYPLSRLQSIKNGTRMAERLAEEDRLDTMEMQ